MVREGPISNCLVIHSPTFSFRGYEDTQAVFKHQHLEPGSEHVLIASRDNGRRHRRCLLSTVVNAEANMNLPPLVRSVHTCAIGEPKISTVVVTGERVRCHTATGIGGVWLL